MSRNISAAALGTRTTSIILYSKSKKIIKKLLVLKFSHFGEIVHRVIDLLRRTHAATLLTHLIRIFMLPCLFVWIMDAHQRTKEPSLDHECFSLDKTTNSNVQKQRRIV